MNHIGETNINLWDDTDRFFYDVLHLPHGERHHLKVRSMVGLVPLFAVEILDSNVLDSFPGFRKRFEWFIKNRPHLQENIASFCMGAVSHESECFLDRFLILEHQPLRAEILNNPLVCLCDRIKILHHYQ